MWSRTACACTIAATALASVALAQTSETPQDEPGTTLEDIEVVGMPEAKTAAAYVRAISTGPVGRLSPVWRQRICVRIVEMDEEHARFLKSRIETVAAAFGVSPHPSPNCRPDISIYASTDPIALATTLIEAAPRQFQPTRNNTTLGDAALEAFRTSSAPIRWWQVSVPLMAATGQPAMIEGTGETQNALARSVVVPNASRLTGNVRDDLAGVTIILDTRRLANAPFGAVSDYVAFVALAPVDPRTPTAAFDTVLNLFERPGVTGLTMTDQDYLYALYASSPAPASASLQAAEIASRMAAERRRRGW